MHHEIPAALRRGFVYFSERSGQTDPGDDRMKITSREYGELVKKHSPNSSIVKDTFNAFWIGGLICVLGQLIRNGWTAAGLEEDPAGTATSMTLVFLGALLTGIGVYDRIARKAGAGTIVPITGFANAVVSPAMEFRTEGLVMGLSAKMFVIAGPVLVYGIGASVLYGLIYWLIHGI
jgi:stage V sporulation protein AC